MVQKRTLGRRLVKGVALFLGGVILLLILVILLLQTPYGQKVAKNQAESYLRKKLQTRLSVGTLRINFLSGIHLTDLYLEDQQKRELGSIDKLDIRYNFSALFRKYIILSEINLQGVHIYLRRDSSGKTFNYDFIPAAFASSDSTVKETSGFSIHLGKVSLDSIHFKMEDGFGGQYYDIKLPRFRTDITSSDLDKLHFHANYLISEGLNCSIILKETGKTEERIIDTLDVTTPMWFMTDTISITKTSFSFENKVDFTDIKTIIDSLSGKMVDYRSETQSARLGLLVIKNHSTEISMKSIKQNPKTKEVELVAPSTFTFYADSIAVENNHIAYNDNAYSKIKPGSIDYAHIGLDKLNIHVSGLGYNGRIYTGNIHDLSVKESSGFYVKQLRGGISYSDSAIVLKKVFLETGKNQLNIEANILVIPGKKATEKNYQITAALNSPALHLDEAIYFQPELAKNKYFIPLQKKSIQVSTVMNGTMDRLHIPQLIIKEAGNKISASADILNLPDTKNMVINLQLKEFSSSREGILSYLPKGTIPDSILHYIPETLSVKGLYKGSMDNMYMDLVLHSSTGNATIKGTLQHPSSSMNASYDLAVTTSDIDLKELLQDTMMGKLTASAKFKGKGFDLPTAVADFNVHVDSAFFRGYTYNKVDVKGKLDKKTITADLNSGDPNIDIEGNVFVSLNEGGAFRTNTEIKSINLQALGFSSDSVILKSTITADFPLIDNTKGIEGNILMMDTYVYLKGIPISIDTMQLDAKHSADSQSIRFGSPFANISLEGRYTLSTLNPAIKTIVENYFSTTGTGTAFTTQVNAELLADIHLPDSMISLIPGVKSMAPFHIKGNFDTKNNDLTLFTSFPKIKLNGIDIDTVNMAFVSQEGAVKYNELRYALSMGLLTSSSYELKQTTLQGGIKKGIIDGLLRLDDEKAKPRYLVPFVYTNDPVRPGISIGDSLMINKKFWTVSENNIIYLNPKKLASSHLTLSNNGTRLELKAADINEDGLPLTLNIKEFNIKDIAELVIADTALASGMVNGDASISSFEPFHFTSHISIDSLNILKAKLGRLKLDVEQKDLSTLDINTSLVSNKNDLSLKGKYMTNSGQMDLVLDIQKFDLSNAGPILEEFVGNLRGEMKGNLTIRGTTKAPEVRGQLTADSLQAIYAMTGTNIRIPHTTLTFDEEGIQFEELNLLDSAGHRGKISGRIGTRDYKDINFDLAINMSNFEIIGRKKFPQQDIYGPTNADVNLKLSGDLTTANIEGSVKVKPKSNFTYVYRPENNDQPGEGLVEFFNPLAPQNSTEKKRISKSTLGFQLLTNMYVNLTPETTVEIMLDELSGDHLQLNGNADLNLIMRPGGDIALTGAYLLEGGIYELSLAGLIRKKFNIEKGSTINWNGDPLKGIMNITALYKTKTSAGQLVNDIEHVPGIDKQKLNFEVYIILKNELLKPEIDFRLDMEERERDAFDGIIYNRIKQVNSIPAELNKQVMGLLAFNQFIAENPFNSFASSGGDFETQAFNTAGELLTQELTDMVGRYVKDVNIDFGLEREKDYTSGKEIDRTDFNVGISKSLADNRLNVFVGSTFALEGANQDASALEGLAGDVTLEYLLTRDGKYRLKGYRLTENDLTFQGSVVRTGVSFVVVLEFNRFKNAFRNLKKPKKKTT